MNENGLETGTAGLTGFEIAVIGMSGRFPGGSNIEEFWDNLKNGREGISFFSDEELQEAGVSAKLLNNPNYVKAYGWLDEILCFDAEFFGYTPPEAEIMDPQVRLFHQCAYEALEDAGYDASTYKKLIGIYAGASASFDWQAGVELSGKARIFGRFAAKQLTDKDFLCTRAAYNLSLKGPAVTVDTACSTSLTAIHLACQGLIGGDCDMALAGGVTVPLIIQTGYLYHEAMITASDGHCRAFDARADGSSIGNAVAIVVLKRYTDAVADGDNIYAMIKGSAINNDGDRKAAYTAPSIDGQSGVIRTALRMAEVDPETISYVETHGTGTTLGDPVEIEGLKAAFNTKKKHYCRIGSVKTNLGHLEMAAGVTGFIKTVLALKHRQIPPSLYFETPNPKIDFDNSPFVVNTQLTEWNRLEPHLPLRAGVSSFGIGGTNAHVILEEFPLSNEEIPGRRGGSPDPPLKSREYQLILLSAKTETALEQMTQNLARHFQQHPDLHLADAAYTLQVGRRVFPYRRMLVCPGNDIRQAVDLLAPGSGKVKTHKSLQDNRPIIFMFSGLGAQYVNMGRDLYQYEPIFRSQMDQCFEILNHLVDRDIKEILYPGDSRCRGGSQDPPSPGNSPLERGAPQGRGVSPDIDQPGISQMVIFIFEYALAQLLMSWGIKPHALIGYSFGEYTAACVSGVFSLKDGLKLVVSRGQFLQETPPGVMLSVPLPSGQITPWLNPNAGLALSIDNGPSCVVSGPNALIDTFEKQMKEKRVICMQVPAERAIHSGMMDHAAEKLTRLLATIPLNKPNIPYVSNVTGDWQTDKEAVDPAYWARHLRETVRFADGMKTLLKQPGAVFIELGPGRDISTLALRYLENDPDAQSRVLNLVRHQHQHISDLYFLLTRVGQLWLLGQPINWSGFYENQKNLLKRLSLPTYPFEKQAYSINVTLDQHQKKLADYREKSRPTPDFADWFYIPTWTPHLLLSPDDPDPAVQYHWLVFIDNCGLGQTLVKRLKQKGHEVTVVEPGTAFVKQNPGTYMINPGQAGDYHRLFKELATRPTVPGRILHLWGVTGTETSIDNMPGFEKIQESGFYSLLHTAKALGREKLKKQLQIDVITDQVQEVTEEEWLCPAKATIMGPVRVIPQEFPGIRCRSIDVVLPEPGSIKAEELAARLEEEVLTDMREPVIAYRGSSRWIQTFHPLKLDHTRKKHLKLREKGLYLVTGGLGNIGLMLADYLARKVKAKLILTGRTPLPHRKEWEQWLKEHDETDPISQKIKRLKTLEESGAEVRVYSVDTADKEKMREVIHQAENQLGPINGIIHAAGIMTGKSFNSILQLEIADCQEQFHPKVKGLLVLEELFAEKPLDFCWLLSSIATVLGGLGITAYAAANSFMDALAGKHNRTHAEKWISVDWDGMDAEKTQVSFERILSLGKVTQVVASNGGNLQERIDRWVKLESLEEKEKNVKKEVKFRKPRPALMNPYAPPQGNLHQTLVEIWQSFFGFEQVGIQDDFIELGGDSLKAIAMINQVQRHLDVSVPITEFFKNPTIERLAEFIAEEAQIAAFSPIIPVEKKDYYGISSAQKRLYILQQIEPKSTSYNNVIVVLLQGDIERPHLENTFKSLTQRHDSLRTSFTTPGNEPVQRIHQQIDFQVEYYDLKEGEVEVEAEEDRSSRLEGTRGLAPLPRSAASSGRYPKSQELRAKSYISSFIRPFDLSKAPLLRIGLVERGEKTHILMVDTHHIISDGMSLDILTREFILVYSGEELPGLSIQYKDYSAWRNSRTMKESIKKQEEYWKQQFAGPIPVLNLPTDYPRPELQSFEGRSVEFALGKEETLHLGRLAFQERTTPYMVLLALFNIFLAKLSDQEDIIVGTDVAGRNHSDTEYIIGMFVNTLALRNFPAAGKTFKEFLAEIRQNTLSAFENQDYPLEDLVETIKVKRDSSRNPLFGVLFSYLDFELRPGDFKSPEQFDLKIVPFPYVNITTKFDLSLTVMNPGEHLRLTFEYCTKLFKEETIQRFAGYFKEIASSVIKNPDVRIGKIEIVSEEEKKQLIKAIKSTKGKGKVLLPGKKKTQKTPAPTQAEADFDF